MTRTATDQPAKPLPIDPGDACLWTDPDGEVFTVEVVFFQPSGNAVVRVLFQGAPIIETVPLEELTRITH